MLIVSQNKEKVLWFGRDCRVSDKGTVLAGAERFLRSI